MTYFQNCLICNSENLMVLKGYEKDYLIKCKNCSFVFSQKQPTYRELIEEYAKYSRSNQISEITLSRYYSLLEKFEKYRIKNNIIDIGAGDGFFAEQARLKSWNSYATEFDDKSVALCLEKGVVVHKGKLDVNNYEKDFFDIIFSSEVLEHINNPVEEIKGFHTILRPGGLVYLTTPNLNSISHKILKNKWNIFHYPEHISYYSPKTIEKLFNDNGFKKLGIETTGFSPQRYFQSLGKSQTNDNDDNLREKTENKFLWRTLKQIINSLLNVSKTGDAMKVMFVKV